MASSPVSPRLANIRLHPIKSLDPFPVKEARIGPSGGLEFDRAWALYSADGQWVNGKRTAAVHLIRAAYAPDLSSVTFPEPAAAALPRKLSSSPAASWEPAHWFGLFLDRLFPCAFLPEASPITAVAN